MIPKVEGVVSIDEFRPVSMVGSFYKVIVKVLARRLRSMLGSVISNTQSGFIEGRNITDNLITVNSAISWLKQHKTPSAIFKIDFKKANDSVRWLFLHHI